jgi:hypothetical protein
MHKNLSHTFPLLVSILALQILVSSCVTQAPGQQFKAVPAGHLYKGNYINIHVPNSEGWRLLESSPDGMGFARMGEAPKESFGAQVLMFGLEAKKNKDEFVSFVKQIIKKDGELDRYAIIKSTFEYHEQRGYPCVKVTYVTEDKQSQTSPTHRETLLLQAESLYCRHPERQDTGFAIIYSHRGSSLYSNLHSEAQAFIDGVQVPGH